jgi:hypothetical protein
MRHSRSQLTSTIYRFNNCKMVSYKFRMLQRKLNRSGYIKQTTSVWHNN